MRLKACDNLFVVLHKLPILLLLAFWQTLGILGLLRIFGVVGFFRFLQCGACGFCASCGGVACESSALDSVDSGLVCVFCESRESARAPISRAISCVVSICAPCVACSCAICPCAAISCAIWEDWSCGVGGSF